MSPRRWLFLITLIALLRTNVEAQDTLTNGLVAYYTFNGTLNDQSGAGNNALVIGFDWANGVDRFGLTNSLFLNTTSPPASDLDGTYAIASRSAALDFNHDFTLSVWVNISDRVPGYYVHSLLSNGLDTNGANFRVISGVTNGADALEFICNPSSGDVQALVPASKNIWWQAVVVHLGTNVSLYRNGGLLVSVPMTATMLNSSAILFGRYDCDTPTCADTDSLIGEIDDIRMYNRSLSSQEVKQLYLHEANALPFLTVSVKALRLSLFVTPGSTNQLFTSTNLLDWTPYGPSFTATNSIMFQDVDVTPYQQFFEVRLQVQSSAGTLTLTNSANQISSDPEQIVAYLNNSGSPMVVGSRSGIWSPGGTWTMSLAALTPGQAYTFELQDTAFGNAVIPPRSNLQVVLPGASLTGYIYNNGGPNGYFGWFTKWAWGP